jgi:hypothetical protein
MADGIGGRGEGPTTRPGPIGGDTGQRTKIVVPGSKQAGRLDEANEYPTVVPSGSPDGDVNTEEKV